MRRLLLAVPALLLALGATAACGGDGSDGGIATAGGPTDGAAGEAGDAGEAGGAGEASPDPEEAALAFTECMRDHGIEMPDPDPDGGMAVRVDPGDPEFREAMQACRELMPAGGERPDMDPAQVEKLREFAQCMRDNGVDMPDPDPQGGFPMGARGNFSPEDPEFQAAMEACQHLMEEVVGFRGGR